jgi:hypothetical protein
VLQCSDGGSIEGRVVQEAKVQVRVRRDSCVPQGSREVCSPAAATEGWRDGGVLAVMAVISGDGGVGETGGSGGESLCRYAAE